MNQIGIFILFILFPGSSPSSDRVTVNKVYDLESKLTGVEYVISGVIASDSGTYKCTAANTVNVVTKEITMTVTTGVWVSEWQGVKCILLKKKIICLAQPVFGDTHRSEYRHRLTVSFWYPVRAEVCIFPFFNTSGYSSYFIGLSLVCLTVFC